MNHSRFAIARDLQRESTLNHKIVPVFLALILAATASSPRNKVSSNALAKPVPVLFKIQGSYEETYEGKADRGRAEGKLVIKFEAARWVAMSINEVGNAEFSELANAPAPEASGSVSYDGRVKGANGGNTFDAMSSFAGPLTGKDVVLGVPEYTDTNNGFKLRVAINPKLRGKCAQVEVRDGATGTADSCQNGTYFFTASSPMHIDDNDDPGKTADTANFGLELDIEPERVPASNPQADSAVSGKGTGDEAGDYAWRGAITNGSKESGFKIMLNKTKESSSEDTRGHSTRKFAFNATIGPKSQ